MGKKERNRELAQQILGLVGGTENISFMTHCMTRLRFNLKNHALSKEEELKKLNGVLGLTEQNGQLQVIIGNRVNEIYDELCEVSGFKKQAQILGDDGIEGPKEKKHAINAMMEIISGCFAPVVTAFAGAGIMKGLLTLLVTYHLVNSEAGVYIMLNAAADSVFYFLPFILAFTAAKKMNTNEVMALVLAGIYMYPSILNNAGTQISVLGINVNLLRYSSSALPILLSVWAMSYVYRFFSKHVPALLRVILVPIGVLLVMTPLNLMVFGPLGNGIGGYLGKLFKWLFDTMPAVGGIVAGATRPFVIFTGMHTTMTPILINNIETLGYDMIGPTFAVATMSAAGMAFGVFLRAKNENNKSASFSAFISAFIGITEPALYGIAFRFKKALIALCIGGAVSGAFVAIMRAKAVSFAMPALISLPVYAPSIGVMLIGFVIAFVLTAVLAYVLGIDEDE